MRGMMSPDDGKARRFALFSVIAMTTMFLACSIFAPTADAANRRRGGNCQSGECSAPAANVSYYQYEAKTTTYARNYRPTYAVVHDAKPAPIDSQQAPAPAQQAPTKGDVYQHHQHHSYADYSGTVHSHYGGDAYAEQRVAGRLVTGPFRLLAKLRPRNWLCGG